MRSIMWAVMTMSLWAGVTMAQKVCSADTDCSNNQYCYKTSNLCANYTLCSRYNRKESSEPSHEAIDCGECLEGYSEAQATLEQSSIRTESCTKDPNVVGNPGQSNTTSKWLIFGSILLAILCVIGVLYVIRIMIRRKFFCKEVPAAESEKPGLLMIENGGIHPSAPPAPSSIENQNNNNHHDAEEEKNLLSTTGEHYSNLTVDKSHPVKAQGYHPPNYVRTDPNYNPGDTQTVQTFSPPDIDEETIPSEWTPGPTTGGAIPVQPFASIAEEVQDNTMNSALQRLTCPSPSTSQEGHENRQNGSSGNSGGFGYSNPNENTSRGNSNPGAFMQVHQIVNVINQWGNGS